MLLGHRAGLLAILVALATLDALAAARAEAGDVDRVCGLPLVALAEAGLDRAELEAMEATLDANVEAGEIAGYLTLVTRGGSVVEHHAHGLRDVEASLPIDDGTLFRLASLTKPIVSAAALTLVDDGAMSLDDPVARYLPSFDEAKVLTDSGLVPVERAIALRDLFLHTAGIAAPESVSGSASEAFRAAALGDARDLTDLVNRLATVPLVHQPGEGWTYGYSTDVLARVAEIVSGLPLERLIAERITGPLGMESSRYLVGGGAEGPIATLYTRGESRLEPVARRIDASFPRGITGLASTACDYLRFARMLLGGGQVDGVRILRSETVEEMTRNHLPESLTPIRAGGFTFVDNGFGLGVAVSLNGAPPRWRPGAGPFLGLPAGSYWWLGAVQTYFWVDPSHRIVGLMMVQSTDLGRHPLQYQFQTGVYRALGVGD